MVDSATQVLIHGAAGRMGLRLAALAGEGEDDGAGALSVAAAVDRPGHPLLGRDVGAAAGVGPLGVELREAWPDAATAVDVVIDFSTPEALRPAIDRCVEHRWALVVGTTGLTDADQDRLDAAAHDIAVLQASNFSRVVNVLWKLAGDAARLLGDGYDIEVLEAHHRFKRDAPSGTALTLVRELCNATGRDFDEHVVYARHGDAPRGERDITVQTLRIGDDPGQHTAYFAGLGERLELKHVSTSRDSYARGALDAAKWLAGKPAGRYAMHDVLGV